MNRSSIVVCRAFAISWASLSEGLYFPCSRKTIVSRRTPTFFARSSWVRDDRVRYSFILVCMAGRPPVRWFSVHIPSPEEKRRVDHCGECKNKDRECECILCAEPEHVEVIQPDEAEHEEEAGQPCPGQSVRSDLL